MIKSIEEMNRLDEAKLAEILRMFDSNDIVKAAKGVSPSIHALMQKLCPDINFMAEHEKIGAVKIEEVENKHAAIVAAINANCEKAAQETK